MAAINEGRVVTLGLRAGESLTVESEGVTNVVRYIDGEAAEGVTVTNAYPVTLGPLTVSSNWHIEALSGGADYSLAFADGVQTKVVRMLEDDLPEFGQTGVIYETEAGWMRWDELTGVYLATDEVPAIPAAVAEDDPVISGDDVEGSVLTVTYPGGWTNRPSSFLYQWENDGEPIEDQTGRTYTTVTGDVGDEITCEVTGVNAVGSAEAASTSNGITVVGE